MLSSGGSLAGVRVLDIATLFPAPLLAAMLGDLGADVVKVEAPEGDPLRRTGVARHGKSTAWALVGRNKRSVIVDTNDPDGLRLLHRLGAVADIVVANQPRAVLERWGCTYDELAARNPRTILVLLSGFGADGPYADRAASGTLAEAFAGLTHMIGEPDGPPMLPSVPAGDVLGALVGLSGTLAALHARGSEYGRGQVVDVSLYESVLPLLATTLAGWDRITEPPARAGSRLPSAGPRSTYRTADGRWIALSGATDAQAGRLLDLIGAREDARERFGSAAGRVTYADDLDDLVRSWVGARNLVDAMDALERARVPASPVNDLASLLRDAHVTERGSIVELDQPAIGTVLMPAAAPRLSGTPSRLPARAPELGEHTEAVRREWLGELTTGP
jgi:crotonobetainyl-CoA:carnitine CoA-transferase CaiB-like acyl-CoA transferase